MTPKKEGGKVIMACSCGYTNKKVEANTTLKEEIKTEKNSVEVVSEDPETLSLTDEECPKCAHTKAYYWVVQTRAGDEPETKFLKCEKCKYTWRDYD